MRAASMDRPERCVACICGQCSASDINQVHALKSALDQAYSLFGIGVLLFDNEKNLLHMNELARARFDLPEAVMLTGKDLIHDVFDDQCSSKIEHALDQLLELDSINEIRIALPTKDQEYSVVLQRLEKSAFGIEASGVVMFILKSTPDDDSSSAEIARMFGLTKAEARLTHAIAHGMTAAEYSEKHGISIHTAYSQIKNILSKTGTRRQAELVKLVMQHSPKVDRRKNPIQNFIDRRKQ